MHLDWNLHAHNAGCSLVLLAVPGHQRNVEYVSDSNVCSVRTADPQTGGQSRRRLSEGEVSRNQPEPRCAPQSIRRLLSMLRAPEAPGYCSGNLCQQKERGGYESAAQRVLVQPGPAKVVVDVLRDQRADPDARVHDNHRSRRTSLIASSADTPSGHSALISADSLSQSAQNARQSFCTEGPDCTGITRATTWPRYVTSTISPRSRTRRRISLVCSFNSRTPTDGI